MIPAPGFFPEENTVQETGLVSQKEASSRSKEIGMHREHWICSQLCGKRESKLHWRLLKIIAKF